VASFGLHYVVGGGWSKPVFCCMKMTHRRQPPSALHRYHCATPSPPGTSAEMTDYDVRNLLSLTGSVYVASLLTARDIRARDLRTTESCMVRCPG